MADAFIDTNVFLHAQTNDSHSRECRALLDALQEGTRTAVLDSAVVHELTYIWSRYFRGATRDQIADFVLEVLGMPGIIAETVLLDRTVRRWRDSNAGFVDCLLAERALNDNVPVYTKNVRDLRSQGVEVPDPLPS